FPGTYEEKLDYLISHYGWTTITLPQGGKVHYGQFVVPEATAEDGVLDPGVRIDPSMIQATESYRLVTAAVAGDKNADFQPSPGESSFSRKVMIADISPNVSGAIITVNPTPT